MTGPFRALALALLLAFSAPAMAVTAMTDTALSPTAWTDLGAGPLMLSGYGSGIYAISDSQPSAGAAGFRLDYTPVYVPTGSHVWGYALVSGAHAVSSPAVSWGGGSSGSGTAGTGISPPTGGSGDLGFLSGIYVNSKAGTYLAGDTVSSLVGFGANSAAGAQPLWAVLNGSHYVLVNNAEMWGGAVLAAATAAGTEASGLVPTVNAHVTTSAPTVPAAGTASGATPGHFLSAASTNATSLKAAPGTLYSFGWENTTATVMDIRFYDTASAPTCSSATGVVQNWIVPAQSTAPGGVISFGSVGAKFVNGIGICITGANADNDPTPAVTGLNFNYTLN